MCALLCKFESSLKSRVPHDPLRVHPSWVWPQVHFGRSPPSRASPPLHCRTLPSSHSLSLPTIPLPILGRTKKDKLNGTNGFLQKSAVCCGFLRNSVVSCGFLRKSAPPSCCNSQEKRKSANICENPKTTKTTQTATNKELSAGFAEITEMTKTTGIQGANHGFPIWQTTGLEIPDFSLSLLVYPF